MAIKYEFSIIAYQADCSANTLSDNTVYGNGELERHQMANFVIGSKMDVEGTPTYLSLDNSTSHNISGELDLNDYVPSTISFPTTKDGWYQFLILSIPLYSNLIDYTAGTGNSDCSVVYNEADDTFYKCIQANGPGTSVVAPESDPTYWTALSLDAVESTWVPLIDNTQLLATTEHNDLVTCRSEDCLAEQLEAAVDAGLCKDCNEPTLIKKWQRIDVLLNGALAKNYQEKMAEAEEIIRGIEDFCKSC